VLLKGMMVTEEEAKIIPMFILVWANGKIDTIFTEIK
jgi:hypothetical protein